MAHCSFRLWSWNAWTCIDTLIKGFFIGSYSLYMPACFLNTSRFKGFIFLTWRLLASTPFPLDISNLWVGVCWGFCSKTLFKTAPSICKLSILDPMSDNSASWAFSIPCQRILFPFNYSQRFPMSGPSKILIMNVFVKLDTTIGKFLYSESFVDFVSGNRVSQQYTCCPFSFFLSLCKEDGYVQIPQRFLWKDFLVWLCIIKSPN